MPLKHGSARRTMELQAHPAVPCHYSIRGGNMRIDIDQRGIVYRRGVGSRRGAYLRMLKPGKHAIPPWQLVDVYGIFDEFIPKRDLSLYLHDRELSDELMSSMSRTARSRPGSSTAIIKDCWLPENTRSGRAPSRSRSRPSICRNRRSTRRSTGRFF